MKSTRSHGFWWWQWQIGKWWCRGGDDGGGCGEL